MMRWFGVVVALLSVMIALSGAAMPMSQSTPPDTAGTWYRPPATATWQWQLQGDVNQSYNVDVYDIDLFDSPVSLIDSLHQQNRKVICYFSAGSYEPFRPDAADFPADALGRVLEGFEQERWVDVRSSAIRQIALNRLDLAVAKGCDGVEPDNVDGYANATGFDLTYADQLNFNQFLADEAHARGLAVGLKNDLDQIPKLLAYFDFSVNEQCHEYDECLLLEPFVEAGKPVFNAEYAFVYVQDAKARQDLCQRSLAFGLHTLVLPLDLDDSFRFSCDP